VGWSWQIRRDQGYATQRFQETIPFLDPRMSGRTAHDRQRDAAGASKGGSPCPRCERIQPLWAVAARSRPRSFRPEVVHAHLATPGLSGAAWPIAGSRPMVITMHLNASLADGPRAAIRLVIGKDAGFTTEQLARGA
jgi:hypothetical protein